MIIARFYANNALAESSSSPHPTLLDREEPESHDSPMGKTTHAKQRQENSLVVRKMFRSIECMDRVSFNSNTGKLENRGPVLINIDVMHLMHVQMVT